MYFIKYWYFIKERIGNVKYYMKKKKLFIVNENLIKCI